MIVGVDFNVSVTFCIVKILITIGFHLLFCLRIHELYEQ